MTATIRDPADVLPGLPLPVAMATTVALADGARLVWAPHDVTLVDVPTGSHDTLTRAGFVRLASGRWAWRDPERGPISNFFAGATQDRPPVEDTRLGSTFIDLKTDEMFILAIPEGGGDARWFEVMLPSAEEPATTNENDER